MYLIDGAEMKVHQIIILATAHRREEILGLTPALIVLMQEGYEVKSVDKNG